MAPRLKVADQGPAETARSYKLAAGEGKDPDREDYESVPATFAMTSYHNEIACTTSDEDRTYRQWPRSQCMVMTGVAVLCIVLGAVLGRGLTMVNLRQLEQGTVEFFKTHELRLGSRSVRPDQYLTVFTTQIELINVSSKGDGWSPLQLAVSGNAADRGEFCDSDDPREKCTTKKNPEWVNINGIWALVVDPEKELGPNEKYKDEELIETRFQVTFTNRLDEPTLMHFHGLVPPNNLDGVPFISANPLQPNHTVFYDFVLYHRGFYWLHSHFHDHAGSGLFAPMIVKDHPDFRKSIGNPQEVLMIVFDNHWRAPCAYQRHLYPDECPTGGFDGWDAYSFTVNGRSLDSNGTAAEVVVTAGKKIRLRVLEAGTMAVYRIRLAGLKGEVLALDGRRVKRGFHVDHFPIAGANRVDILIDIPKEGGCFPIVASRASCVDQAENTEQGALMMKTPGSTCSKIPYKSEAKEERLSLHDWMHFTGMLKAQSPIIDPLTRPPDVHHVVRLTGRYEKKSGEWNPGFTINERELHLWPSRVWCKVPEGCDTEKESVQDTVLQMKQCQGEQVVSNVPCDFFKCKPSVIPDSDGRCVPASVKSNRWKGVHISECKYYKIRPAVYRYNHDPLEVCHGDRVWITFIDAGTFEGHPIHLHGTHQQLIKINGTEREGPLRDTWFMVKHSNITVAFDALNPGEWLLHCHIEHHLANGMATTLRYVMNDRCKKRLDTQQKANWQHSQEVKEAEWPQSWRDLYHQKKTPKNGLIGLGEL